MNQCYEPYLAHWRPKGSKNGMHLFGIAQDPSKYANGTATAGLMDEWNRRQRRIGEWNAWAKQNKQIANGRLNANNVVVVDEKTGKQTTLDQNTLERKAQKRYEDATRRANIHRAKSNELIDNLGQETFGKIYNTPLKHLYRTYFKTAAKVYGAGGFKNYIKQTAGTALKNIGGLAKKFKNLITRNKSVNWAPNPIALREDRKAARRAKKLSTNAINNSQSRWKNMTNYYKSPESYNARANAIAAQQRGKQMTAYNSNPTAYRAKERSNLYRTNSRYLPTAVV